MRTTSAAPVAALLEHRRGRRQQQHRRQRPEHRQRVIGLNRGDGPPGEFRHHTADRLGHHGATLKVTNFIQNRGVISSMAAASSRRTQHAHQHRSPEAGRRHDRQRDGDPRPAPEPDRQRNHRRVDHQQRLPRGDRRRSGRDGFHRRHWPQRSAQMRRSSWAPGLPTRVFSTAHRQRWWLDTPAAFKGTIVGFDALDKIDLSGVARAAPKVTLDSKECLASSSMLAASEIASLQLTASNIGQSFTVGSDRRRRHDDHRWGHHPATVHNGAFQLFGPSNYDYTSMFPALALATSASLADIGGGARSTSRATRTASRSSSTEPGLARASGQFAPSAGNVDTVIVFRHHRRPAHQDRVVHQRCGEWARHAGSRSR